MKQTCNGPFQHHDNPAIGIALLPLVYAGYPVGLPIGNRFADAMGLRKDVIGDAIERRVRWKNNPDLAAIAGKPVRLRFAMRECDLYSFRFRKQ